MFPSNSRLAWVGTTMASRFSSVRLGIPLRNLRPQRLGRKHKRWRLSGRMKYGKPTSKNGKKQPWRVLPPLTHPVHRALLRWISVCFSALAWHTPPGKEEQNCFCCSFCGFSRRAFGFARQSLQSELHSAYTGFHLKLGVFSLVRIWWVRHFDVWRKIDFGEGY